MNTEQERAAVEADRKRRQKPALTAEKIRIIWKETLASMGDGGDPVLWFARAIERAHGISAPQPAEPVKVTHPAITHCDNCGCDWLDNGLNPIGCPYCKISALREALEVMVEMIEMKGFGFHYAMDLARAALAQGET